jgi:hypothetical protein
MIRLLQLIFAPAYAWHKILQANRGVILVLILHPLPLMLIGAAAEGYGLMKLGWLSGELARGKPVLVPRDIALRFEEIRLAGSLLALFLGTLLLRSLARSFQVPTGFPGSFAVLAYSMGPLLVLAPALDGLPFMNSWLCWSIGIILSVSILYNGIAIILQPEPTKGFGLFVSSAVVLIILTGFANFIAILIMKNDLMAGVLPKLR